MLIWDKKRTFIKIKSTNNDVLVRFGGVTRLADWRFVTNKKAGKRDFTVPLPLK